MNDNAYQAIIFASICGVIAVACLASHSAAPVLALIPLLIFWGWET